MSNGVDNELLLTGEPEAISDAIAALGDPTDLDADQRLLSFARLRAMPAELLDRDPTADCASGHVGPMDWFCWRLEHWGTKGDAAWVTMETSSGGGSVRFEFSTPATPPLPLLPVIAALCPGLSIDFAYLSAADEYAGSARFSPTRGWSEPHFSEDLAALGNVLGGSRLAARLSADPLVKAGE